MQGVRRGLHAFLFALVSSAVVALARPAAAQHPFGADNTLPTAPTPGGTEQAVVARYWELGRTRPFVAATLDLGIAYLKPRILAGYGRPYWSWIGVEAYPVLGLSGLGQYTGVAAALPGFTLRGGSRYFYPFARSLLEPKASYTRTDLELLGGPRADYLAFEGEAAATAPLFNGSIFGVLTGYRISLVEPGYYLFEEGLRTVVKPPYVWRARAGYLFAFGRDSAIRLGAAGDFIGLPGRDEYVVRGGIIAAVAISAQLEAQASMIPVLVSPDRIGLAGGDFGQLGIRLSWATQSKPDPARVKEANEKR